NGGAAWPTRRAPACYGSPGPPPRNVRPRPRPSAGAAALREPSTVFVIQALLWIAGLFGLIRLPWVDGHVIRALVTFQTTLVAWNGTEPPARVLVTSSCSGADAAALCLGVTLAYPVAWSRRLTAAALGIAIRPTANARRITPPHPPPA